MSVLPLRVLLFSHQAEFCVKRTSLSDLYDHWAVCRLVACLCLFLPMPTSFFGIASQLRPMEKPGVSTLNHLSTGGVWLVLLPHLSGKTSVIVMARGSSILSLATGAESNCRS